MRRISLIICLCLISVFAFSQGEGVEAIMGNPHLQHRASKNLAKVNVGTFDSTFIYFSDTINLPIFDEFSSSKFQVYNATFPGDGFDKVYRLLDMADVPISNDSLWTTQQTFKRTFDLGNSITTDQNFPATQVKIGDLSSYPVTHIPTDVYPPFYIYDTLDYPNPVDTIWILDASIYQDSATQFFSNVNDPTSIWLDDEAYHNYSMALDPWSLGVVTFDGLDPNGFPYAIGTTTTNYADHLTSKPIDMSGITAGDSIYFSFLYQAEGLCDQPESIDSLILEFYAKDLDQWNWIWSVSGTGVSDFNHVHIKLDNPDYFKKGFQFRFKNYGGLSGSLDHFHIDYVDLRTSSGYQDTVIDDLAFVYPLYTLLDTYTSVPWDHYSGDAQGGRMSSNVQVVVRNSNTIPKIELDGTTEIKYAGLTEGSFVLQENLLNNGDLNYLPMTTYYSYHDFLGALPTDSFHVDKTGPIEEFDIVSTAPTSTLPNLITQNDSTFSKQYFQNFYSYDDGSAEQAYGPTGSTGIQARLAIKYTPYEADSLIGIMIHFVPTVIDVSNKQFLLTVWDDNGGEPGSILYEDELFFPRQPSYEYDRNIFTDYYFKDTMKVPVTGTFYVGWRQFDPERLGVGLDRNIINNDKTFYSIDGGVNWNQSGIPGSVMIRPIFSTSFDAYLGLENEATAEIGVNLYPNPTTNIVNIEIDGGTYHGVEVYNIQGVKVIDSNSNRVDLSNHSKGMYFFKIKGQEKSHKVIRQ